MEGGQHFSAPDRVQVEQGTADGGKMGTGLKARKRTKTGCLTCRRRRIKCGEEKPTCKNCTKSKRECEGYVPRVIFKDPVNAIRADMSSLHGAYYHGHATGHAGVASVTADGVPLAPLAPRPSPYHNLSVQTQSGNGMQYPYLGSSGTNTTGGRYPRDQMSYNGSGHSYSATTPTVNPYEAHAGHSNTINRSHDFQSATFTTSADGQVSASSTAPSMQYPTPRTGSSADGTFPPINWSGQRHMSGTSDSYDTGEQEYRHHPVDDYLSSHVQEQARQYGLPASNPQWGPGGDAEADDDYYDVDSEEEKAASHQQLGEPNPVNLGLMMKLSANQNNPSIRSITNFLNGPNMLATYTPIYSASPLMDPQTAMVFCHFIAATGPTLNVFERHPSNPSVIFTGRPAPQSQRSLWSYTMPMLALTHQGLLQAMLALSSLHIAKIQRTSPTPSLKHYHYALRRVAKALNRPDKRRNVATLAATLLLGFYEVTTAEHNKWNSHLSGARELIMEIDFVSTARRIERARAQERDNEGVARTSEAQSLSSIFPRLSPTSTGRKFPQKLDPNFIGTISGWRIQYDEHGPVAGGMASREEALDSEALRPHEVEEFEIKCDLFWWYAKQDVFQSVLSGNRLLLPYERWGECPPRAPMGRQDAPYGTMDHLMMLMSRLADYAAKDLPRKRKAAYVATSPTKTQHGSPTKSSGSPLGKGPPPMYGMIPDPGPIRLPTGFDQVQHDRIYSAPVPSDVESLDQATQEAETEHAAISHAFDVFFEHLGPSFAPLAPEHMTPTASPFGPAIYYRSYTIACVVSLYYCGRIIICRTAPNMPPAAMAAAGVAAASTAGFCNLIGRISAGIQPVSNTAPLNPQHGAALMDSCMGLFHAGVQYRDAAQRGWLITKLRDISRLTGWQTSALIASGCERAWVHAADMGRGPPYERTMNAMAQDDRVAGRSRDPRLLASPPRHNNDRRFVHQNAGTRVYWAMGILSVEEDMRALSIEEAKADEEKRLRQHQHQHQRTQISTQH